MLWARCPAWALASLANICREKDNQAAIDYYRRALALDYDHVQWRFALAKLLVEMDKIHEAINETRICLRFRPEFKAAEELIAELSMLPGVATEDNPPFYGTP